MRPALPSLGLLMTLLLGACGGPGVGPSSPTAPRVTSVSPASGTTLGGTVVTLTGANFSAGSAVTVGGAAATQVTVVSPTSIAATTPQHAAGAVDVVVTFNGQSGSLAGGYTFVAPAATSNAPPVVSAMSARGSGPREPAQFASLDEVLNVSATVSDVETPVSQLTLAWSADAGTFAGSGTAVTWKAPHTLPTRTTATSTGAPVTITLTVTERYATTDASGLPVTLENQTRGDTTVRLHDSVKEVGDMAYQFLIDFSTHLDPPWVVRNFTDSCPGKAAEQGDVERNNRDFLITSYSIGPPDTTVGFTGTCPFRGVLGDACAQVPVEWHSTRKATGERGVTKGIDQVTAVFANDRWWLCASDFNPTSSLGLSGFMR
ncbi:MAG: hypothetical protein A3F69_02385 [Acidobacteria bacterium RIFCSPLOWO2_12_FULL_66_10]|nr:MAG: hypothetical protein A3F69_02385 [Acidobacteria bacterium RIFCSPLOWO2_12_FULL_66_10]